MEFSPFVDKSNHMYVVLSHESHSFIVPLKEGDSIPFHKFSLIRANEKHEKETNSIRCIREPNCVGHCNGRMLVIRTDNVRNLPSFESRISHFVYDNIIDVHKTILH